MLTASTITTPRQVKKAINLVNEVFAGFLNVSCPEYMVENFRMPESEGRHPLLQRVSGGRLFPPAQ